MQGNMDILTQGAIMLGGMILILSPEFFALAKGLPNKALLCLLGLASKVACIYFFSSIIAGTFLG